MASTKPHLSFKPTYHTQKDDGSWDIGFAYTFPHNYHRNWGLIIREGRQLACAGQRVSWLGGKDANRELLTGHMGTADSHIEYHNRVVTGKTSDAGLVIHNWIEKINPDARTEQLIGVAGLGRKSRHYGKALDISQLVTKLLNRI